MIIPLSIIASDYWNEAATMEQFLLLFERVGTVLVIEDGRITATGKED